MGYGQPVIHLPFDQLSENPAEDKIWVAIRNPQLQSPESLRPSGVAVDENGRPIDQEAAVESMYGVIAGLILAWRVYDTAVDVPVDEETREPGVGEQNLQPPVNPSAGRPATPDLIKRLPMVIITEIMGKVRQGTNHQ